MPELLVAPGVVTGVRVLPGVYVEVLLQIAFLSELFSAHIALKPFDVQMETVHMSL